MPVKRKITEPDGIYFITITCHQWLALIEQTRGYDLVYNWFDHLKSKGHFINGYVIMPNHLHALIAFRNTGQSINTIVGNGKRFIAYEIINRLKQQGEIKLLHQLNLSVEAKDRERNKKHEVWEDSFDWKECRTHKFMKQKLDYIHNNPCRGKWNLASDVTEYVHSSARFYLCDEPGVYPVINFLELDDIDLTKNITS
ncbi:transposase [Terrimonas alba]|uniref:transposase n=1 Tax=Terrimonas alba TaxID=3349636 RepID=UPI0035F3098C